MNYVQSNTHNQISTKPATPWSRPKRESSYNDEILTPKYADLRLRLAPGDTWLRILPPQSTSAYDWLLGLHVIKYEQGRFAHPRSITRNAKSAFDHAYAWALQNAPASLYSKTNKSGARLLTDPVSLCWVAVEQEGRFVPRLFLEGAYDGSRGGMQALGYRLWDLCTNIDPQVSDANPLDSEKGVMVCIEKSQPAGAKYPTYHLKLGRKPHPIADVMEAIDPAERELICPLKQVVHKLSDEEQWDRLARTIAPETVALIRESLTR
jgi:hypothetical protein